MVEYIFEYLFGVLNHLSMNLNQIINIAMGEE